MAAETRADYYLPSHCGETRSCVRTSEIPPPPTYSAPHMNSVFDPHVQYYPRDDKRNAAEAKAAQYHSWSSHFPVPAHVSYPTNEVSGPPQPMYGVHDMRVHMPNVYPAGVGPMVATSQPAYRVVSQQPTPRSRGRNEPNTDSSSSNCTPRDHYGVIEKNQHKKHSKKNGSPRLPIVKIPEMLKKQGQPSPAQWVNLSGYPLRPGKPDCKHYTTKGWCAYGSLCKFNHPDSVPINDSMPCSVMPPYGPVPPTSLPHGVNSTYMEVPNYPPQWVPWTQPQMYPMTQGGCYPAYACSYSTSSPTASTHSNHQPGSNGNDGEKPTKDSETNVMYH